MFSSLASFPGRVDFLYPCMDHAVLYSSKFLSNQITPFLFRVIKESLLFCVLSLLGPDKQAS